MNRRVSILAVVLVALISVAQQGDLPAYHEGPPPKGAKLPAILTKSQLWSAREAFQRKAYELAAKHSDVIYQLPCMCHCERVGHTSLRSCFESLHGAGCYVCMKEVFYTDLQRKKGKSARQIRTGVLAREHNKVEIDRQTGDFWMP